MSEINTLIDMLCVLFLAVGLIFIYYISRLNQYNEASLKRTRRRIEDAAYYLSKLEEQIEDIESQTHKKIEKHELETRIKLTASDNVLTRMAKRVAQKRRLAKT